MTVADDLRALLAEKDASLNKAMMAHAIRSKAIDAKIELILAGLDSEPPPPPPDPDPEDPPPDPEPPPPSGDRALVGRPCRYTPSYLTPRTHAATAATLQAVLNGIAASTSSAPAVVETTGLPVQLDAPASWQSFEQNVLVRPPLGQRITVSGEHRFYAARVTLAGFDFTGTVRHGSTAGTGVGRYSHLWMCRGLNGASWLSTNVTDGGLVECVLPDRGLNGDSLQVRGASGLMCVRYRINGCWIEGKDRDNGTPHNDTIQFLAGQDCEVSDSVILGSMFAIIASNEQGALTGLKVANNYLGKDSWPYQGESTQLGAFIKCLGLVFVDNDSEKGCTFSYPNATGGAVECQGNRIAGKLSNLNGSILASFPDNEINVPEIGKPTLSYAGWAALSPA